MTPADIALAEAVIEAAVKAADAVKLLCEGKPEVYAAIGQHHKDALARARVELAKP